MPRSRADICARQIRKVCAGLPEAEERSGGHDERHLAFTVRRRTFGYLTNDHHGGRRTAGARESSRACAAASRRLHVIVEA